MSLELSIVLPVYDEAEILEDSLTTLTAFLETLGRSFEIVAVDDGSRDDSWRILEERAAAEPRLSIDRLEENQGKGAAVRRGVLQAEGRCVLFMDVDLSTPLEEIPRFLGALDSGYDVVIGSRRSPGAVITRHQPWIRETLGRIFTVMTRMLLARGVQDFTCGFKAFHREPAREIFRRSTQARWAFDAELTVIAQELGYKLAQVPVSWHHEEGSKVRLASAVPSTLRELGVIAWNRFRGRYR